MKDKIPGLLFLWASILLLYLSGCKPKADEPNLSIGQAYRGGIIIYMDNSGHHGLIAAENDLTLDEKVTWFNGNYDVVNTSVTDGHSNTTAIINKLGDTGSYAARICRDYRGGGFTDWFLPAKDQLNELYKQKNMVGGFIDSVLSEDPFYWSSTMEIDPDCRCPGASGQDFLNGLQDQCYSPYCDANVRPVRAF